MQKQDKDTIRSTLKRITVNPVELCTRHCPFCPRYDSEVFPNRNLHMTNATIQKLSSDMQDLQYTGEFFVSGFGEPLLHKHIYELFKTVTDNNNVNCAVLVTNGDPLTPSGVEMLKDSGVTKIVVSLYDDISQKDKFIKMIGSIIPYELRERYYSIGPEENYGIEHMNNRSGLVKSCKIYNQIDSVCYLPFNKCQVDWNGDILLCDQDWGRNGIVGNIHNTSIGEIWLSPEMKRYRQKLIKSDRSLSPCNKCDVNGKVYGEKQFNTLRNYYESSSSR